MRRSGRPPMPTMFATMARIKWWLVGVVTVMVVGCVSPDQQDLTGTLATAEELRAARLGVIDKGSIAFGESIRDISLSHGERHGFTFYGSEETILRAKETAQTDGNPDALLLLLGPPDGSGKLREILTWDDNSAGHRNALIDEFRLPASGEYQLIATSYRQQSGGTYTISLACLSSQCAEAPSTDQRKRTGYERTRLASEDIIHGRVATDEMFRIGDFLFDHHFVVEEGLGNGLWDLPGSRSGPPNLRRVHWKRFGGPDTTHCSRCHSVGGADGGGDRLTDVFQEGDGENTESALERNAPALLGLGYVEKLAGEMTDELKEKVASARRLAGMSHRSVTVALTAKGIAFGTVRIEADGQHVDYSGLQGVDGDLVVKPFGWKGHTSTIRRFVDDALRTHLGIQTDAAVARNCQDPDPEVMGSGPDCKDPDGDGVTSEFTEGQLTALAVYVALTQVPVRVEPVDPVALQRATAGEALFSGLGCTLCHVQQLPLENPVHVEAPDVAAGPPLVFDLTAEGREPRLHRRPDGRLTVELLSDLKRHDMGPGLADPRPASSAPQVPREVWLTPPLWGVGATAPYLHDGRAPSLRDAILAHGGEATPAQANFARLTPDEQEKVVDFLRTLGRDPARRGSEG